MTQRISRRQALGAFGTVSLGALLGACGDGDRKVATTDGGSATVEPTASPASSSLVEKLDAAGSCAQTAEQTEGPYYFDADAVRSDIREDRDGTVLELALRVREADGCTPIENAIVDVWHCDAGGVYSGFAEGEGERFLRGAQATDAEGIARFKTIYPGHYQGRTVHIHLKVHLDRRTVLTTQLYFDDEVSDRVFSGGGYPGAEGRQRNDSDGIYEESLLLALERSGDSYLGLKNFDVART